MMYFQPHALYASLSATLTSTVHSKNKNYRRPDKSNCQRQKNPWYLHLSSHLISQQWKSQTSPVHQPSSFQEHRTQLSKKINKLLPVHVQLTVQWVQHTTAINTRIYSARPSGVHCRTLSWHKPWRGTARCLGLVQVACRCATSCELQSYISVRLAMCWQSRETDFIRSTRKWRDHAIYFVPKIFKFAFMLLQVPLTFALEFCCV